MKRLIILGVAVIALGGCGGGSKTVVATTTATVTSSSAPASATSTVGTAPTDTGTATANPTPGPPVSLGTDVAVVGQAIVGQAPDAQLTVRVTAVEPIPSSDYAGLSPPQQPADGVKLVIKNTGSQPFTDDLSGDVKLASAGGQVGSPDLLPPSSGFCAQSLNSGSLNLQPGDTVHLCVAVTPPVGSPVGLVRFTPDAGLSMDYAEWKVP